METRETLKDYGVQRGYTINELAPPIDGMVTTELVIRMSNQSFITVERVDVVVKACKNE